MDAQELKALEPELAKFMRLFEDCFSERWMRDYAQVFVSGQLSDLDRKSLEPIAMRANVPPRSLQEFFSLLQWDHAQARDIVQRIVATEHAGPHSIGLVDETSFVKKGTKTPGVQRQWCGHLGKVENCVVTVHLGYVQADFHCLIDGDLYLPESWANDRERCRRAGIPDDVLYRPKWQIALELYDQAVANGVCFEWLTFDEHYGGKPEFLAGLTQRQQKYVAEVPKSVYGWLTPPRLTTRPLHRRGRRPVRPRWVAGSAPARRLDKLLTRHPKLRDQPWTLYRLDDREQGPSVWEVKHVVFYPQVDGLPGEPQHLIVARHVLRAGDVKYFLSNAPLDSPVSTMLRVALTRHCVERCFEDEKGELGLDHFEGRTYCGLIRHLTLTQVSYLFLARATQRRAEKKPRMDGVPSAQGDLPANQLQVA